MTDQLAVHQPVVAGRWRNDGVFASVLVLKEWNFGRMDLTSPSRQQQLAAGLLPRNLNKALCWVANRPREGLFVMVGFTVLQGR